MTNSLRKRRIRLSIVGVLAASTLIVASVTALASDGANEMTNEEKMMIASKGEDPNPEPYDDGPDLNPVQERAVMAKAELYVVVDDMAPAPFQYGIIGVDGDAFESLKVYLGRGFTKNDAMKAPPLAELDAEALTVFEFVETNFDLSRIENAWRKLNERKWREEGSGSSAIIGVEPKTGTIKVRIDSAVTDGELVALSQIDPAVIVVEVEEGKASRTSRANDGVPHWGAAQLRRLVRLVIR